MDDVFTFRNRLIGEYSSFSRSFSKVASPDILVKVEEEYARGRYWPEPLIQINPNYKRSGAGSTCLRQFDVVWRVVRRARQAGTTGFHPSHWRALEQTAH
jgi:hypothetical protein